jgi:hypothetical protein
MQVSLQVGGTKSGVFEFVGFTTATTTGNIGGIVGANQFCEAEFGADARICTTDEYVRTPSSVYPSASSWIHPTTIFGLQFSLAGNSCNNWTSNAGGGSGVSGVVVGTDGTFRIGESRDVAGVTQVGCQVDHPVTCCSRLK